MFFYHNYCGQCWICGSIAETREHIYKKSDLKQEFNSSNFKENGGVLRVISDDDGIRIPGPNSKSVKFSKNLCQKCNSDKSSSWDKSYEQFTAFYKENETEILQSRIINFLAIYGEDWEEHLLNLRKYYVKHIGCKLSEESVKVLPDLVDFLEDRGELISLKLVFYLRRDIMDLLSTIKKEEGSDRGYLGLMPITGKYSPSKGGWDYLIGGYNYRALTMSYYYSDAHTELISNLETEATINLALIAYQD